MHPARLFVLCGPPGSATIRAEELEERFGAVRMSNRLDDTGPDLWDERTRSMSDAVRRRLIPAVLRAGTGVVVESGTDSRAERDALLEVARAAGARAHLEFVEAAADEPGADDRHREHVVGPGAITGRDESSTIVERPTLDELRRYDPMPPVRAGERPGSPAFPYGSWIP